MESGYDLSHLVGEAQIRWLKPSEVLFILQNYEESQFTHKVPTKPPAGSLFLFNKRVLKSFRKDGHSWRKRRDQRTLAEAHERLKVGNAEALNCYYAHGDGNPNFQRRSYWMLDPAYDHIVLVHYREVAESRVEAGSTSTLSGYSFEPYQRELSSAFDDSCAIYNNDSSPASMEISSSQIQVNYGSQLDERARKDGVAGSSVDLKRALRKLQRDLSLDDDTEEGDEFCNKNEYSYGAQDVQGNPHYQQIVAEHYYTPEHASSNKTLNTSAESNAGFLPQFEGTNQSVDHIYASQQHEYRTTPLDGSTIFGDNIFQDSPGNSIGSTITTKKFSIREISPEWCYHLEGTKIIIVGSFLSHPADGQWACVFDKTEVPVQIIQQGVLCCHAPPHLHGIVDVCITWNSECCSEVRKFEFRSKPSAYVHSNPETESKTLDELLLLVKFVQMLKGGVSAVESDNSEPFQDIFTDVINSLWDGSLTSSTALDWIIQELLKDKLAWWLSSKSQLGSNEACSLSKEEQGILHIISALGFEWALQPLLKSGVGINFRDVSGWTALHWAAKFGRYVHLSKNLFVKIQPVALIPCLPQEKMATALIASGASAGLVTDPNTQDPVGQTPGSIASACGHTGLAGYLSEVALTSHHSSLTLEECEVSKGIAAEEAERTVNMISDASSLAYDDKDSLYHSLVAVRNAAQAAARIQAAFRAHSFRKRQQRETEALYADGDGDEYSILESNLAYFPDASKSAHRNARKQLAAVSIQKKYKAWKGRKDFIGLRRKVIKIQAHFRGYDVRKKYKICWAVGILDKAILRWKRHGSGLRGFKNGVHNEDEEDDDILKEFRKQKVDAEIDKAISRVLIMVRSLRARQQYHRIIKDHIQSKLELKNTDYDAVFSSHLAEISSSLGIPMVEEFPDYLVSEADEFIIPDPASWASHTPEEDDLQ